MKNLINKPCIAICVLCFLWSCDYIGSYTFIVENSTAEDIELIFSNDSLSYLSYDINSESVTILSGEEQIIRIIEGSLNVQAHDCLTEHGISHFNDLFFDLYLDGEKIEKQLWQAINWDYKSISEWSAEYKMTITNELCGIE